MRKAPLPLLPQERSGLWRLMLSPVAYSAGNQDGGFLAQMTALISAARLTRQSRRGACKLYARVRRCNSRNAWLSSIEQGHACFVATISDIRLMRGAPIEA